MTSLSYEHIYSYFLSKITDYKFLTLPTDDAYELMRDWLRSALSKPYLRRVFSSITLDDEIMEIKFEVADAVDDEADKDYGVSLIASAMVVEWLEPQVNSMDSIAQMFGGKEQKYFSQSQHLAEKRNLLAYTKDELRKNIRDHGYFYRSYSNE